MMMGFFLFCFAGRHQQFFFIVARSVLHLNVYFADVFAYNPQRHKYHTSYQPDGNHQ